MPTHNPTIDAREAPRVRDFFQTDRILISVIVPTLNEEKVIAGCLNALASQSVPANQFEVIVIDNGSVDRTLEIAQSFTQRLRLTVLEKSNIHVSALRNAAAQHAKGSFFAFLDADCVPPTEWLRRARERLRVGDAGVIGAFYTTPAGSSWVARNWYGDLPRLKQGPVSYVPAGTMFISRSVFLRLGGFDPNISTSEDFEFCQRVSAAGYEVLGYPELSTIHLGTPQTLGDFYRKQRWHGNGVRSVFLRDVLNPGYARTVLQTSYTLLAFAVFLGSIGVAILTAKPAVLALGPVLFVLGPAILAWRAAMQRKRWQAFAPLTLLYLTYGLARSLSLLGLNGKRAARKVSGIPVYSPVPGPFQAD